MREFAIITAIALAATIGLSALLVHVSMASERRAALQAAASDMSALDVG